MVTSPPIPMLIGFVGATGSGKTTLANRLVERHGFVRAHMGQPIKDMLMALGLTSEQLTGPPEVRLQRSELLGGQSPRRAMETLGTDWGRRMMSPDIWANAVEARILEIWMQRSAAIVIDDLRFPNDWALVGRLGGILIRISRPGVGKRRTFADNLAQRFSAVRAAFLMLGVHTIHETEFHWHSAPADIDILNDGSKDELEQRLIAALATCGVSPFCEA